MAIHENLTRIPKPRLREVGWSKAEEMAKVARREGKAFDCANWLDKVDELSMRDFKQEVERHLTGEETEALGSDKSRGYMLEMICADFLAGANLDTDNSDALMISLARLVALLPQLKRQKFLDKARMNS